MKLKKKFISFLLLGTMLMNVLGAYASVPSIDGAWNQLSGSQQSKLEQVGINPSALNQIDSIIGGSDVSGLIYPPLKYENDHFTVSESNTQKAFDLLEILGKVPEVDFDRDTMMATFNDVIADINSNSSEATREDFAKLLEKYGFVTIGEVTGQLPGGESTLPGKTGGGDLVAPENIQLNLEVISEKLQTVEKPNKGQLADFQKNLEVLSSYMIDPLTSLTSENVQKSWEQSNKWQEKNAKGIVFAKVNAPVARWNMAGTTQVTIPKGLWENASPYGRIDLDRGSVVLSIEKDTYANHGSKLSLKLTSVEGSKQAVEISSTAKIHSPAKIGFYLKDEKPEDYGVYKVEDNKEILIGGIYNEARGTVEALIKSSGTYILKKAPAKTYTDLANVEWAKKEIEYLARKGYIGGKEEGIYAPKDQITRAEFAVLLTRILQLPGTTGPSNFVDVKGDAWYYNDVMATVEAKLFNGKSASSFDPNGKITRQEVTAVISRLLIQKGYSEPKVEVVEKGLWAPGAIALMRDQDLTIRIPDFNNDIKANANRAEVAYILYNLLSR